MSYVPPLVIAAAGAISPSPPSPDRSGINVWRNKRGGIVATGFTEGGVHWMHWPYLAAYRFAPGDPSITAYPAPNAPLDVLEDTYRRSVVPMALQALGYEALHASASLMPSGVVGFFAASRSGAMTRCCSRAPAARSTRGGSRSTSVFVHEAAPSSTPTRRATTRMRSRCPCARPFRRCAC
jgi:hypothetical protein